MDVIYGEEFLEGTGFKGKLVVSVPSLVERLKVSKETQAIASLPGSEMDVAIKLAEVGQAAIVGVDLAHVESGRCIPDKEEFLTMADCASLVYKVGQSIIQGQMLGKKKEG
jgi:hypothetical protein